MYKSLLSLDEKTILIAGTLPGFHKALALQFLELGSDVALVHKDLKDMPRFTQNLTDLKLVKSSYGRVKDISSALEEEKDVIDVITHSAELFGGIDVYIDTHSFSSQTHKKKDLMSKKVLEFLKGRFRGRLIYCLPDIHALKDERFPSSMIQNVRKDIHKKALELKQFNITVNALVLGPMEEYLLDRFPKAKSIHEAMNQLNKKTSELKVMNYMDVAKVLVFISSSMSSALNGQVLFVNYGLGEKPLPLTDPS